ncbi:MAG: acyltransferase [Pseudomonadota bacterium]|nr:acyltransferase [Pseudomonadota bacterium]
MGKETFGETFQRFHGRTSGFDYLRLFLALGVIFWHGSVVVYGHDFDARLGDSWVGAVSRLLLPMFFALSGFLVAGSLLRTNSLLEYVSFRVLRIFPALAVEVTLSAVVLGALVTTLPLSDYFSEGEFFRYLGNMAGLIYVYLPGVFAENPSRWVNISLWTVPYELECYIVLLGLAAFGVVKRPKLFLASLLVVQVLLPILDHFAAADQFEGINRVMPRTLILCFLAGVGFYIFRDRVPRHLGIGFLAFATSFALVLLPGMSYFVSVPIAYATVVIGLSNPPKVPIIFSGDYSYGLYLYAFPFQQLHMYLFPDNTSWFANMIFAVPATACFAYFSWTCIEKPILRHRKAIVQHIQNRL